EERVKAGRNPLFQSHMWDGSAETLADNLTIAQELLERARAAKIILEVEITPTGGEEDGVSHEINDSLYTTVDDAIRTAEALGLGEKGRYLLAASFGNVHGVYKPGNVRLRPELLKELNEGVAAKFGKQASPGPFDFVFHGGSGSSEQEILTALENGVVKMNIDTDTQYAFNRPLADHMIKTDDLRKWAKQAAARMEARVVEACGHLRSSGTRFKWTDSGTTRGRTRQPPRCRVLPYAPKMSDVRLASPQGRWILLTTVIGSGMAMLDSTVVNVALPRIGRDLDADLAALQRTVNAYMVTLAGLILLGGALGVRFGRRTVFVVGVVWFATASLLCGLAPDAGTLIAARALQGVGGALLTPGSLALIQASFHPEDRGRAVGLWSGFGGIGAAVGPFLSGWLVDGPGWRWVFLINVPVALVCVPVAVRHVPESSGGGRHGRFDVAGAGLGALALALVTYALIGAEEASPAVAVAGAAGLAAAVAFVWVERRHPDPMMPPAVFASRQFTAVNLLTLCVYAAFGGFFFLAALQLQVVVGYSALAAGAALLPTTALMLLLSALPHSRLRS